MFAIVVRRTIWAYLNRKRFRCCFYGWVWLVYC